jgi:FAD/FMN-containing dehydrogenase
VIGLRLVTASGDVIECSAGERPELLSAARVSLGALGVITHVRLQLVPAYRLYERIWEAPLEECVEELDRLIAESRHFEFFWWPRRDTCSMKALHPTDGPPDDLPGRDGERIDHSYRIFPSERETRFNEIEFAVPEERGPDCFREIRRLLLEKHTDVEWPIEYRTLGQDDIYLSPAFGRDAVTISAHQASTLPYEAFFRDVEAIFRSHGGRPHWGKIHTHTADELAGLYPRWSDFQEIRRELDPRRVFMNAHLRRVLG